jgi:predicted dehydrogenase
VAIGGRIAKLEEGRGPSHRLANGSIRTGVVGLGSFGRHHARHYAGQPGAVLAAIADLDGKLTAAAAEAYGAAPFANYRDLIGKVDAVSITVPATLHHAVAADFIDAGVHVFIEKPIATESVAARDLIARATRRNVILQVGHIERFSPAVDELRLRVSNPRRIACLRRTKWNGRAVDVDVILDMMIHDIDLVLTLAKAPPVSVAASGAEVMSGMTDEAEAWLTFANGLIATISVSRVAEGIERKLSVTEPNILFTADLSAPSLSYVSRRVPHAVPVPVVLPHRDNLGAEITAFLKSVATGVVPDVDGRAGLAALEVAERIQRAIVDAQAPARRSH